MNQPNPFVYLDNEEWHYFHIRHRTPFFVEFFTYGLAHPQIDIGFDYSVRYVGHASGKVLVDLKSFSRQRLDLLERMVHEPRYLKVLLDHFYKLYESETLPTWKELLSKSPTSQTSTETLIDQLRTFHHSMARYNAYLLTPLFVEKDLTDGIQTMLAKLYSPDETRQLFELFTTQIKDGLLVHERRSMLNMAAKFKQGESIDDDLNEHVHAFDWMANQLYTMAFHNREYYQAQIQELSHGNPETELRTLNQERIELTQRFQDAFNGLSDDVLKATIETAQEAIFFRNFRGEELYHSSAFIRPLLQEIARRLQLDETQLVFLTTDEMIDLFTHSRVADQIIIRERQAGFALLSNVNDGHVVSGDALALLESMIHLHRNEQSDIRGQGAYPGIVIGPAFIVRSLTDLASVPAGAILISPSTSPAYVPALGRVKGIITDEGGILCHAAMIAREMKIPSVIGTGSASERLKTGDLIELNADEGFIRIVKTENR